MDFEPLMSGTERDQSKEALSSSPNLIMLHTQMKIGTSVKPLNLNQRFKRIKPSSMF